MRKRLCRRLAAFAVGLLLSLGVQTAWAEPQLEKFTLAGWSKPITEIVNLLAEPDLGFFKSEGLDFRYLPGAGGGDALRNLLSGQADIAFTDPGSFFAAVDKGAALRAVYDIYPQNVFNVVTLESSGITHPSELKGKRIGVYSLSSGTRQNLQILLQQVGLTEKDVTIIVTGLLNFAPLMQGQVDATAATDTGLALARHRGLSAVRSFEVADYLNYSSDLLVVRESFYQEHRDRLRRFLAAYRRSAQWMLDEPDQAAQLAVKRAIDGQNIKLNATIIALRNRASVSQLTQQQGLGSLDVERLQAAADAYHALGLISRRLDITSMVATDLLPGAE